MPGRWNARQNDLYHFLIVYHICRNITRRYRLPLPCIGWCITIEAKEVLTPMKRQKKGQAVPRRFAALAMALFAFLLAAGAAGGGRGEITAGSIGAAVLRAELAAWNSGHT